MTQSGGNDVVSRTRATLLLALLLLFFFELASVWIESIYRMALVKLGMGKELYGILFLFAPLALFLIRKERERGFLWLALSVLLAARVLCPMLGAPAQIVVAGLGVAAFLVALCYALSDQYRRLQADLGVAAGLAVLASVALRSWRSSLDVSMDGRTVILGWLLVLSALYLFRRVTRDLPEPSAECSTTCRRCTVALAGMFANFTWISLVASSPAVVNAWCGGGAGGYAIVVGVTAVAFAAAVWGLGHGPSRGARLALNALFLVLLVGGVILLAPALPASPASGPAFVSGNVPPARFALYAALLFSPIILFNLDHAVRFAGCARPRDAVLPVTLGMGLLVAVTFILIFTNVWGYVPYGGQFRNRFYLPFILCGMVALVPGLLRGETKPQASAPAASLKALAAMLAVLALAGTLWCASSRPLPKTEHDQLRIMTYNMQQGSQANGDRDYPGQLALLRNVNPDIIGLQECDTARPSGANVDAVRYLANGLGYYAYYGPNTVSGTFGAAILSRYPLRNPRAFFTYSDSDEVGTAVAEIDVGGKTIAFLSNHPAGRPAVMNAHVDALIAEAAKYPHVIAVGDFNFTAREPYYAKLAKVLVPSAAALGETRVDFHGKPEHLADAIDHIFISPGFRVLESHYRPPPDSRTDHPAHWSVIRIED